MTNRRKELCNQYAELEGRATVGPALFCSRVAGHDGLCSKEVDGYTSHDNKRVQTRLKIHWPSPKMLRRRLDSNGGRR